MDVKLVSVKDMAKRGIVGKVQIIMDIRLGRLKGVKVGNSYAIEEKEAERYLEQKKLNKMRREGVAV